MTSRRTFIGTGAAAIALAGVASRPMGAFAQESTSTATAESSQGSSTRVAGTPTFNPEIDLLRAQEIALEGNDGAVVTKVELEGKRGVLTYTVELDDRMEIDIDATTGDVLRTETDDDDDHNDDDDHDDDHGDDD
jgi:hypothetical protein